jgi:hypothetical protein
VITIKEISASGVVTGDFKVGPKNGTLPIDHLVSFIGEVYNPEIVPRRFSDQRY